MTLNASQRPFSLLSGFRPGGRFGSGPSIHFDTPEDGSGGTGDEGGGNPPPVANPAPNPAPASGGSDGGSERVATLKKERAKFRKLLRLICAWVGIDADKIRIVPAGDDGTSERVAGMQGYDLDSILDSAAAGVATGLQRSGKGRNNPPATGANEVAAAELRSANGVLKRRNDALIDYIRQTAIVEPLRSACVRHGAIDDDNGRFTDIVSQLVPRFRVDVDFGDADEDDQTVIPKVNRLALNEDGSPLIDPKTNKAHTPDTLVAKFLDERPKYRNSTFKRGPGAGGARVGSNPQPAARTAPDVRTHEQRLAQTIGAGFGINPDLLTGN